MVQTSNAGAAGAAPTADQPGSVRNVVLVGHSGAGKTSLVEALLVATGTIPRAGRVEEARVAFEKMLTYANPVGLFSEEIAVNGEQIGNFPQAFTHLSLINAALTLDAQLNLAGRPGHVPGDGITAVVGGETGSSPSS